MRLRKGRGCPVGFMWGTALARVFGEERMRPELAQGAAAQVAAGCPRHRGGWPDPGGGVAPVLRTSVVRSQQNTRGGGRTEVGRGPGHLQGGSGVDSTCRECDIVCVVQPGASTHIPEDLVVSFADPLLLPAPPSR